MMEDIDSIRRELQEAKETIRIKDENIAGLNTEIQNLQVRIDILQKERPKIKPENLITSFRTALEKMQEGLKISEGRVDYVVSNFDTELKVNVTVDEEGNINFQLPKPEDIIPSENLSNIRLSFKSTPKVQVLPPEAIEVPNLIGLRKDAALESLAKVNLKAGAITERASSTAPGTVIEQVPSPYSRTLAETPVDLTVSRLKEVKVPGLVGMDKDNATETIVASNLTVGEITEELSDLPPGTVIGQSITAETIVPIGTAIDLTIALETVKVPNLVGMDKDSATEVITLSKLVLGEMAEKLSESPPGTVISQSITADTLVPARTSIDLLIAKPEMVKVPDVIGRKSGDAKKIISRVKLKAGKTTEEPSGESKGTVIRQSPEAGEEVPVKTTVDLVIATAERANVPDVIGMPRESAVKTIEEARLRVESIIEKPSEKLPGTVIEQSPKGEEKVPINTGVVITVAQPEIDVTEPEDIRRTEMEYIRPEDVAEEEAKSILAFLNSAKTPEEIAEAVKIPGERDVGVRTAQNILDARDELGGFTDLKQLDSVEQVGPERFTEIVKALR